MKKIFCFSSVFCALLLNGCAAWTLPEGKAPDDLTGPSEPVRRSPDTAEAAMASALTRFVLMNGLTPAGFSIQPENIDEQRFASSLDRNLFFRMDPASARFLIVSRRGKNDWELLLKERTSGKILWRKKTEW